MRTSAGWLIRLEDDQHISCFTDNGKALFYSYKCMPSVVKDSGVCNPFSNASEDLCMCVHVCSRVVVHVHRVGVRKHARGKCKHKANV